MRKKQTQIEPSTALAPPTADPIRDSLSNLLAVVFAKSTAANYSLAVNVCQGAAIYSEGFIERQLTHIAVFGRSSEQATRATAVLQYLSGMKSLQIFVAGQIVRDIWTIQHTLECYMKATLCNDRTAHCHRIMDDPFAPKPPRTSLVFTISLEEKPGQDERIDRYLFPCSYLLQKFRFQIDHPASSVDQIQAAGIEQHLNCCPLFQPSDFRKIGTFMIIDGKRCMA
jgi:hypothetical protein